MKASRVSTEGHILPNFPVPKQRHQVCSCCDCVHRDQDFGGQSTVTSNDVDGATNNQPALLRVFHLSGEKGISPENGRSWGALRVPVCIFAGAVLLLSANGCIATRSWVQDQLNPIKGQLNDTNVKADSALAGLQNLQLERRLVLDSSHGPTFAFRSAALTENGKRQIDEFFEDLEGSTGAASGRLLVVAGHTDSVGKEAYNYKLGQRRAGGVAGYLIDNKGVDPTQVRVVSYGASKPIADNGTSSGRRTNRRVEILVYQEKVAVANQEKAATGNEAPLQTSVQ